MGCKGHTSVYYIILYLVQVTNPAYQNVDTEHLSPIECVKSFMHTKFPGAVLLEEHQVMFFCLLSCEYSVK